MEPYWKHLASTRCKNPTSLNFQLIEWAVSKFQKISWKWIAYCLHRPNLIEDSYRVGLDGVITIGTIDFSNKIEGIRVYNIPERRVDEGDYFLDGDGYGTSITDHFVYKGQYKNHQFHGKGNIVDVDNIRYDGQFSSNMMHGEGTMTWHDGWTYHGIFYEDSPLEPEECVHPMIKEYINEGICTRVFTEISMAAQMLSEQYLCRSCEQNGNHDRDRNAHHWLPGASCCCLNEDCKRPKKKRK
eukprot:TRINITY_DN5998_c0_g1_i1.p1 TRINITY_DN5998_c0_g1~~TRINITY_DN5998_c0_g1_i1.p1  ORF type:complete len:282 (+),score=53.58 TRINITY_DN5998_c0_g1_i1:121-846(+)